MTRLVKPDGGTIPSAAGRPPQGLVPFWERGPRRPRAVHEGAAEGGGRGTDHRTAQQVATFHEYLLLRGRAKDDWLSVTDWSRRNVGPEGSGRRHILDQFFAANRWVNIAQREAVRHQMNCV